VSATERQTRTFRIAEKNTVSLDTSPYVLTMTSSDLARYPKAVVTFQVSTESSRSPSAVAPAETLPERLRVRRYYTRLSQDEFGRDGESQVIFNRDAHTVYLGFIGKSGRKYFYKELSSESKPLEATRVGTLDKE
jgi:hypothetical protein